MPDRTYLPTHSLGGWHGAELSETSAGRVVQEAFAFVYDCVLCVDVGCGGDYIALWIREEDVEAGSEVVGLGAL